MTNKEFINKFILGTGKLSYKHHYNLRYEGLVLYSYGTAIAQIVKDVNGDNVIIISNDKFSMTTIRHRQLIIYGAIDNGLKIYYLPQDYDARAFYVDSVLRTLKDELEALSQSKLTQKPNREALCENYEMLSSTLELSDFQKHLEDINALLDEYKEVYTFARDYKRRK